MSRAGSNFSRGRVNCDPGDIRVTLPEDCEPSSHEALAGLGWDPWRKLTAHQCLPPSAWSCDASEGAVGAAIARKGAELDALAVELEAGADHAGAAEADVLAEAC